jgi:hypothetical protein
MYANVAYFAACAAELWYTVLCYYLAAHAAYTCARLGCAADLLGGSLATASGGMQDHQEAGEAAAVTAMMCAVCLGIQHWL